MVRICFIVVFAALCTGILAAPVLSVPPPAPLIAAKSAVVMDARTGLVLWSYHPDTPLPMASTTKIMTAMVILDLGIDKLDQYVTVSKYAAATGGSSVLGAGDMVRLHELLQAILIRSSNEATVAAAEFLTGSEARFVARMNEKAAFILGPQCHTHFVNPHGLYDRTRGAHHVSSARELALLTRYALLNYPEIRRIVSEGQLPHPKYLKTLGGRIITLENHNRILGRQVPGFPGSRVDGVKTGFVVEAGKCLVSSATANGWQLIAVVLGSNGQYFTESLNLLHYGFAHYQWKTYATAQLPGIRCHVPRGTCDLPIGVNGVLGAPLPRIEDGGPDVSDRVVLRDALPAAPIRQGQRVGELVLERDGQPIASAPAIALQAVPVSWWVRTLTVLGTFTLVVLGLYIAGKIYGQIAKNRRRRRRHLAAQRRGVDHGGPGYGQR